MNQFCEDSCVYTCSMGEEGASPPPIPDDSGIDFSNSDELCIGVRGEIGSEVLNVEVKKSECPQGPGCVEELAQCRGCVIFYNVDRIQRWVRDMTCRIAGYMATKCSLLGRGLPGSLISYNVALVAYSYLVMHERAHCAGIKDEGEATAYGLYHTFVNLVMKKLGRGFVSVPIDAINHRGFLLPFLARYLALYEIARQHYRMKDYWNFVKYLKLPLTLPSECYPVYVIFSYRKGNVSYKIYIHTDLDIHVHIHGDPPVEYLGRSPALSLGTLYEVWKHCEEPVSGMPGFPSPAAPIVVRCV